MIYESLYSDERELREMDQKIIEILRNKCFACENRIKELKKENEELKEYKWMYEGLNK